MRRNLVLESAEPTPAENPSEEKPVLSMEQGMLRQLKDVLEKADLRNLNPVVEELERLHRAQTKKAQRLNPQERAHIISTLKTFLEADEEKEFPLSYPGGKTYILEKSGKGITIRLRGQAVDYKQALEEMEPLD